ncbi:MAG TPA: hypothetical protein PKK02_05245 [Nitrosomonas sp.]|nr:hypothetical protein [Nitrosomonas sp.]
MGALVFYTFVFFIGYFVVHGFNLLIGRKLLNRKITALVIVCLIALMHGYKILTSPLPAQQDADAFQALGYYVMFPILVIVTACVFFGLQDKEDE